MKVLYKTHATTTSHNARKWDMSADRHNPSTKHRPIWKCIAWPNVLTISLPVERKREQKLAAHKFCYFLLYMVVDLQ